MDKKQLLLVLLTCGAFACNTSHTQSAETAVTASAEATSRDETYAEFPSENESEAPETGCRLHFDGFEIYMPNIVDDGYSNLEIIDQDTLYFGLSTESGIIDEAFDIVGDLVEVEVLEMESQTIAVYHDDNLCLLDQWKMVNSPWRHMHMENGKYISFASSTSITSEFPDVSEDELREAVRSYCEESSEEFYQTVKSPMLPPCEVFTRSRTIRISGKRIYTGQPIVKHLIFNDGFGC